MSWYNVYDGVFFLGIATTFAGVLTVIVKSCSNSRCQNCSFCYGALTVERNVELEQPVEMVTPTQSNSNTTTANNIV
jgi:hypothetical protein